MLSRATWNRRDVLRSASCGFGALAFAGLCSESSAGSNPLVPKPPHFIPRAKRVIFLFMRGGPAQMDTFEYKPQLLKDDNKPIRNKSRKALGSPFKFQQHGQGGQWISELCPHVARHADDLCILNGMHTDVPNHTAATLQLHTGSFQFVRPSAGAWVLYGLGTENQNLPGFISISPPIINGGAQNYGSAFLPAAYQGTPIGDIKTPVKNARIGNLRNPRLRVEQQRQQLDFIQSLNEQRIAQDQVNAEL